MLVVWKAATMVALMVAAMAGVWVRQTVALKVD